MANLQITKFDPASGGHLTHFGILGGQSGGRVDLLIGTEAHTDDFPEHTIVRLLAETDCVIRIGEGATAVSTEGDPLKAGIPEVRYVKEGERISVVQP